MLVIDPVEPGLLVWRGPPPRLGTRLFLTAFLAIFLAAPVPMAVADRSAASIAIAAGWSGVVLFAWWGLGALLSTWTRIRMDPRDGLLRARRSGRWLWLRQTVELPVREVRKASFTVRGGGGEVSILLELHGSDPAWSPLRLQLSLDGVRDRKSALEFVGWFSACLGRGEMRVVRDDHLEVSGWLAGSREPALEDVPGEAPPPPEYTGPFEVLSWRPGDDVHVRRRLPSRREVRIGAAVAALFFVATPLGLIAAFAMYGPGGKYTPLLAVPVLTIVGFLIPLLLRIVRDATTREEVRIGWAVGVVTAWRGEERLVLPLAWVQGVVLEGTASTESTGHGDTRSSQPIHWTTLWLDTDQGRVRVLETAPTRGPDPPYLMLRGRAEELARALGREWSWGGYRRPEPGKASGAPV